MPFEVKCIIEDILLKCYITEKSVRAPTYRMLKIGVRAKMASIDLTTLKRKLGNSKRLTFQYHISYRKWNIDFKFVADMTCCRIIRYS